MAVIEEVTAAYEKVRTDQAYLDELDRLQTHYTGRPSPLYEAARLSEHAGGARIFLKREDLNHTGSHKINNVLGQALLARQMGKTRVIAETGAGQHGVATATACALLGLDCVIYMGAVDTERQALNVARMRLLGAEVVSVESGSKTLKDAINEAFRDWVTNADDTYYCFGTAAGPHPFPTMVRDFQRVIGLETRVQIQDQAGRLPDAVTACVGGGSNAIGIFHPFLDDPGVRLVGFEAAGDGVETGRHAATFTGGSPGAFQGSFSFLLQDEDGQSRLDVAVQQSALMCIVQRVGDGADDLESQRLRHSGGIPAAQQFGGVGSLDVIHRQPQLSLEFAAVVNTDDVGMPQLRGDVCFPAQPLPVLVVRRQRGRQDLEGVAAGQPWMLRQIDLAHAAGSQPPDDGVSGEHVPVVQRHTGLATRP